RIYPIPNPNPGLEKSLAHERPACPLLRNKDRKAPPLPLPTGLSAFSKEQQLLLVVSSAPSSSVSPGVEPLFPKLPPEERRMALQYISHSDPAERQARILRVQQSAPVSAMDSLPKIPKISTNIDKGKGHVFGYEGQSSIVPNMQNKAISVCNSSPPIFSRNANDLSDISDHEVSSSLSPIGLTVFRVGSSSGVPLYGTRIDGKKGEYAPNVGRDCLLTRDCLLLMVEKLYYGTLSSQLQPSKMKRVRLMVALLKEKQLAMLMIIQQNHQKLILLRWLPI
ncbi:unnamed protein product, partial [Brassica oleracea var. botrytis]